MTRRRLHALFGAVLCIFLPVVAAFAVNPDEKLSDPALEARARAISQDLRCVVCPNQSIDDSNAPLAKDLRLLIRERLTAGDSDNEAFAFIVARYGNFVSLRPPIQTNTLLLWFAPALLAAGITLGLVRFLRRQQSLSPGTVMDATASLGAGELTPEETKRLKEILERGTET